MELITIVSFHLNGKDVKRDVFKYLKLSNMT